MTDVIRLALANQSGCKDTFLILAGKKSEYDKLIESPYVQPHPDHPGSVQLFPIENKSRGVVRLQNPSKFRAPIIASAARKFQNVMLPSMATLYTSGFYPASATPKQYVVHVWTVIEKEGKRGQARMALS